MSYLISLFAPENTGISATGTWCVAADSLEQAVDMAKYYADSRLWPSGSTWLVVPLEGATAESESGTWNP
ncbi:MAG: hypothetical protein JJ992_10000 [Planctomycetes bacterium]|nr:hypothetical protein [Planctomycetota bacterium]